jgi:hypothetical protein
MLLIHCGHGLGQGAIASDPGDVGCHGHPFKISLREKGRDAGCRPGNFPLYCRTAVIAAISGGKLAITGGPGNRASSAQSSGLAIRSSDRPKLEIPDGLGSEFVFGAPQPTSGDEGAISSPE